jgi:hypothetical protein
MRQVMVRYTVKPEEAENNTELVHAVYEELHRDNPSGMRYATFQLDDGVSFIHLHSSDSEDGAKVLPSLPAFQRFQAGIADRCVEGPVVTELREVGSYRAFEARPA